MEAVSDAFAELFHKRPDPEASNKLAGIFRDAVKLSVKLRCQEAEYDLLWPQDRRFDQLTMELEGGEDAVSKRRLIQLPLFPGLRKKLAGSTEVSTFD